MYLAISFILFGIGFLWAGCSIWDAATLSRFAAAVFFSASLAEFVTGGLYASASLLKINPGPIFKDPTGRLRLWPRLFIWPYLIVEYSWWRKYRRRKREPLFEEVTNGLWLGSLPTSADLPFLRAAGVSAALDLVAEMADPPELRREFRYLALPTLDGCAPTFEDFAAGVEFVKECRAEGRAVLIHCTFGHGRSAALMIASMVALGEAANTADALARLKKLKRRIFLSREQKEMLGRYLKTVSELNS